MDEDSKEILRYTKDNRKWHTGLYIGGGPNDDDNEYHEDCIFNSSNGSDFTQLDDNPDLRVADEILQAYQENNNLTRLDITCYNLNSVDDLQNGGEDNIITPTLRRCTHLRQITLYGCNIPDEHFLPMIEAIRRQPSVEHLSLPANHIGNTGCQALATLLEDSNCNLQTLELQGNRIGMLGVEAIANSLSNNTKLKKLNLVNILIEQPIMRKIFYKVVCDKTSVNSTYSSNHTIEEILSTDNHLTCLLDCNRHMKEYAAVNKILHYHPNIDMEPFFELGTEDSERNLKALPYIIDWFERAKESVLDISFIKNGVVRRRETATGWMERVTFASEEGDRESLVDTRKLSFIYQFALAMPLQIIPSPSDISQLHKEAPRDQLKNKKMELERQIVELEDKIKAKDKIIEHRCGISDSSTGSSLAKKTKYGS